MNIYSRSDLQENIFQYKEDCQNVHEKTDLLFFCFTCEQVDHYIGDNSHGDTFGNTVQEWHCDDSDA